MDKFNQRLIQEIEKEFQQTLEIDEAGKHKEEPNLLGVFSKLDYFYAYNKLKTYCYFLSYTKAFNSKKLSFEELDIRLIKLIIEYIHARLADFPIFKIYLIIHTLFDEISESSEKHDLLFDELCDLIQINQKEFPPEIIAEIYSFATNYCTRQINDGKKSYRIKYFIIINKIIDIMYGRKSHMKMKMPGGLFKNTAVLALSLKDHPYFKEIAPSRLRPKSDAPYFTNAQEWVESFIEFHKKSLEKKDQKIYYHYCLAFLAFENGKFGQAYHALYSLQHIQDTFINMHVKILYLKTLYELYITKPIILDNDDVQIEKVLESYRGLIRYETKQKKQLSYQQTYFISFRMTYSKLFAFYNKYGNKLYNYQSESYIKEKNALNEEIDALSHYYKDWFKQKLADL